MGARCRRTARNGQKPPILRAACVRVRGCVSMSAEQSMDFEIGYGQMRKLCALTARVGVWVYVCSRHSHAPRQFAAHGSSTPLPVSTCSCIVSTRFARSPARLWAQRHLERAHAIEAALRTVSRQPLIMTSEGNFATTGPGRQDEQTYSVWLAGRADRFWTTTAHGDRHFGRVMGE